MSEKIQTGGPYYANWAMLMGLITYQPYEIAIMGQQAMAKNLALQQDYLPTALFMGGSQENLELLKHKLAKDKTLIYVCRNKTCQLPVTDVQQAAQQIKPAN